MAGTANNFAPSKMAKGPGKLFVGVAIPAANARLLLAADGTPDTSESTNALHVGHTTGGSKFTIKPTFESFNADEVADPVIRSLTRVESSISAELMQIADVDVLEAMTPGIGTKVSGTGYEGLTLGTSSITYPSVAITFPTLADPTKFGCFQLYKASIEGGIDTSIARNSLSAMPVTFTGLAVSGRAATDSTGAITYQV